MSRISKPQVAADASALIQVAERAPAKQGPAQVKKALQTLLDAHQDATPELRAQRQASILKEVDARKGQLSAGARSKLERLLKELVSVDLDTMRLVMDRPKSSPEAAMIAGALKLMHDPASNPGHHIRPSYLHYDDHKVDSIVANPIPNQRTPDDERAEYQLSIGAKGLLTMSGAPVSDGSLRILLRDDGQWFATRPGAYGLREFAIGEDRAVGSIGVVVKDGKITGFEQAYTPSSGAEYETYGVGLALMFLQLEAQGVKVGPMDVKSVPMYSWDPYHRTVDEFLRGFAQAEGAKDLAPVEREAAKIAKLRADRQGSMVGKTPASKIVDPGVDRATTQHAVQLTEGIVAWAHVTGISGSGSGLATIPTRLGELSVDASGKKLKIIDNGSPRAPSDAEAQAIGAVLSKAVTVDVTDKTLALGLLKALEGAKGPLARPPAVSSLRFTEVPKGLVAARFVDPRDDRSVLSLFLTEQGPLQGARDYAFGVTYNSMDMGLGALSPDGKSQYLEFQAYGHDERNFATLCQLATATGRTMHAAIRGIPIYAEPKDATWKLKSRLESFSVSMGWIQHDSAADHRRSLASYKSERIPAGKVLETVKGLGSSYGDYVQAGMARIADPDNMMEFMLHLRGVLPPEALRDCLLHAVSHDQVLRGSEQAWLDTLNRVLLGPPG
ncbi:MAG: hypothetical protein U1E65_17170 [Myxococcota bacterium]